MDHTSNTDLDVLTAWVAHRKEPFTMKEAIEAIYKTDSDISADRATRIGMQLRKLGCRRTNLGYAPPPDCLETDQNSERRLIDLDAITGADPKFMIEDLIYLLAVRVESSMLDGGARPGVDYTMLDLYKLGVAVLPSVIKEHPGAASSLKS